MDLQEGSSLHFLASSSSPQQPRPQGLPCSLPRHVLHNQSKDCSPIPTLLYKDSFSQFQPYSSLVCLTRN